jgi:phage anti-repressor protein
MPERLREKPILSAEELHRFLEERGLRPIAVTVDNAAGRVVAHFASELGEEERRRLMDAVLDFHKRHLGLTEGEEPARQARRERRRVPEA